MTSGKMLLIVVAATVGVLLSVASTAQAHPSKCSSCHVPHKAATPGDPSGASYGVPLWNPSWGGGTQGTTFPTFNLYTSPTFDALTTGIVQPDGPSKLCLGCHDGAGNSHTSHLFGGSNPMTLTESHPISFVYDTNLATLQGHLKDPSTIGSGIYAGSTITKDLLDNQGKMQCTSCHDVHSSNTTVNAAIRNAYGADWGGTTLRFSYTADLGKSMCRTCHIK